MLRKPLRKPEFDPDVLRIVYLSLSTQVSGAEFSLIALLRELIHRKVQPLLITPEEGIFTREAAKFSIQVRCVPEMKSVFYTRKAAKIVPYLRSVLKVAHILRSEKISVIHSNSPRAAYVGGLAARLTGIPSVVHVRDIVFSPFASALKSRFLNWISDAIITVSDATRLSVIRRDLRINQKIQVIVNGIAIDTLDRLSVTNVRGGFGVGEMAPLVGSVGMISEVKGNDVLVKALAIVKRSFPQIKALIIGGPFHPGDEEYFQELKELVWRLGLENNMIFTGFRENVFDLIRSLDLLVHPAVYPDPLPRVLLETAALRVPIVATRVGGVPEIIEDGKSGVLVEPGDPEALAQAMIGLLKNKVQARRFAETARKRVEDLFSIQRHADRVMEIYRKILDKN